MWVKTSYTKICVWRTQLIKRWSVSVFDSNFPTSIAELNPDVKSELRKPKGIRYGKKRYKDGKTILKMSVKYVKSWRPSHLFLQSRFGSQSLSKYHGLHTGCRERGSYFTYHDPRAFEVCCHNRPVSGMTDVQPQKEGSILFISRRSSTSSNLYLMLLPNLW